MTTNVRVARSSGIAEPLLRIEDVRKSYPLRDGSERIALDGVSIEIAEGEILAVVGGAGSGKSTLGLLAAGLESPCSGRVTLDGRDYESAGAKARRGVATLGADPDLPPGRTVREILAERHDPAGLDADETRAAIDTLIDLLELGDDADRLAEELSDGERRRAALGRALAGNPRLLVLDEATSALDPEISATFLEALVRITRDTGLSALLMTHDMTAVTALARRVVVLDRGRVVEQGSTARVFSHPEHPTSRRFAAAATGATLPPFIAAKLQETPSPGGKALVRLAFEGPGATKPVLTSVARELGFDLGILAGSLGAAGGEPYGVLIVAAPSDEPYFTAAIERLEDAELGVEVLGFVS
ncbi:ATP-binding cassette domain-containing protein [Methylopila sp. M107]|uniref:ATP-binding cassette domain-containing protein n=1 Tax=Methylopila sp. M107 TaxID=1101190 RepID=UPI00036FACD9|nr:ATP-binding cassette domain-containing protein [Methylopila sp. M107]